MKRKPIKTKIPEIVNYWFSRIDESDFSVDAAEAHERCWRCGCKRNLERCHIVPDSLGALYRTPWEARMSPQIWCSSAPAATRKTQM